MSALLSLGTMQFGQAMNVGIRSKATTEMIKFALDRGINFMTRRMLGESETLVAKPSRASGRNWFWRPKYACR
ncbi:MAG: hypothetical protein R3E39_15570 [Anaerolineae bacterium]